MKMDMIDLEIVLAVKRAVVLPHIAAVTKTMLDKLLLDIKYQLKYIVKLLWCQLPRLFDVPLGYHEKMTRDFAGVT